jgi:NtrC-family two-component system response regulator AlgB
VVLSRGNQIEKEDLPDIVFQPVAPRPVNLPPGASLEDIEAEHIRRVLALTPTLEDAAETLGIGAATLWRKRKRYHLD